MAALKELISAALKDPLNQKFMLLSESGIPLYPGETMWVELMVEEKSRINACELGVSVTTPSEVTSRQKFESHCKISVGKSATERGVHGADSEQHVPQMDAGDGDRLPQAAPLAEEQPMGDPAVSAACIVPIMRCDGKHGACMSVSACMAGMTMRKPSKCMSISIQCRRDHAQIIAEDKDLTDIFTRWCYMEWRDNNWRDCYSDEHYLGTLLASKVCIY